MTAKIVEASVALTRKVNILQRRNKVNGLLQGFFRILGRGKTTKTIDPIYEEFRPGPSAEQGHIQEIPC